MVLNFAKKEKVSYPESWDKNGMAGKEWYFGFYKRHPKISLRTPEQISMQRAKGFNKESIDEFFVQLSALYAEKGYKRDRIWNMDESGFPTVPNKVQRVLTERGTKRVSQMSSAERGTNVTCAATVNAAGTFIPPFFLFPRVNMQGRFMDGCTGGSVGYANGSGYMQQAEFLKFMQHFIESTHASKDSPSLLLLDNHMSHLSIDAIDLAVDHGVTMLSFPPHCTHKLQPLDNGVFFPLKTRYGVKVNEWMVMNVGRKFDIHHVAPIVEKCFDECITAAIIKAAFTNTGIYELNRNVFTENDFLAAKLIADAHSRAEEGIMDDSLTLVMDEDIPTGSFEEVSSNSGTSNLYENLNAAGPLRAGELAKRTNRGRKGMKSCILTSPQMRIQLKEAADKRESKKRIAEDKLKAPNKRIKGEKSRTAKPQTSKQKAKTSETNKAPATKSVSPSKSPSKKSTRKKRIICPNCSSEIEPPITSNNTIKCNTCHAPHHLRCVNFTGSYFTCDNCNSDLDD